MGGTTSGVERCFSDYQRAIHKKRADISTELVVAETKLRKDLLDSELEETIKMAQGIWREVFGASRASGVDRQRRWVSGLQLEKNRLKRKLEKTPTEGQWLQKRRSEVDRACAKQNSCSPEEVEASALKISGGCWTASHDVVTWLILAFHDTAAYF